MSCLTLAIAGTLPRPARAVDITVNSTTDLRNAITAVNGSSDASSTIQLGSSFEAGGAFNAVTKAVTINTGSFTLSGNMTTSAPFTFLGTFTAPLTFIGTLVGGVSPSSGGALEGLRLSGATAMVINDGSITGGDGSTIAGAGVTLRDGSFVNNGTVSGGTAKVAGAGGNGITVSGAITLTNNGTIQGGNSTGGVASGVGVVFNGAGATLVNNGTILGGSDPTGAATGGVAVTTAGGVQPITNTGKIIGGNGAVAIHGTGGNLSIVNSGTIQAGSGQLNAIQFAAPSTATMTLELDAGSTITGNVVANTGVTNTLTLGGTANSVFDVSTIGATAQYQNFNVFQKTGTSTWALTGTGMTATPWSIQQGTLQIGNGGTSGSIIGDVTDNATLAFNRSDALTFDGVISGTGNLNQLGAGTTILTAANSYAGDTNVMAGTLAVGDAAHTNATIGAGLTTVAAGATLGGYGTVPGSVNNNGTIAAANALAAFGSGNAGTFNIGGDLNNAGVVSLAAASGKGGNVLNVAGNYTGTNGQVVLNTLLNQGGSASQTDRLVVGGNVSGTTSIRLNQSGSGAQTVGDGIQLVQVNGTSAANSFHLAGPVQAGAFQYLLFQGGASNANDWYLRSQFAAQATTPPDNGSGSGGGNGSGNSASPATAAAAAGPVAYRPAVVGYSMTPLLNADYGFSMLGRLHERVGDIASVEAAQPGQAANGNGVWGRIGGQNLDADSSDRFSADEHTFFAQFGKDWTLSRGANGGSTHAGATVTIGSTSADFNDSARNLAGLPSSTGSVETQAQSIGGYWTRYLPDGSYFDGVGQFTHYRNKYGDVFGESGTQNGFGAGVSGEVGKPFAVGSTGVAIEPQAQLLYQYLHLNHFDDDVSEIGSNTTNGLRGRLGFRLFRANLSNDSKTSSVTPYFTADVLHDFFSPGQTTVGGTSLDNELGKTWYELGVGVTGNFSRHSELYANVKYAHDFSGDYRRNVFAQAGYRFSW
jgi:outer membrane autotransporter protein